MGELETAKAGRVVLKLNCLAFQPEVVCLCLINLMQWYCSKPPSVTRGLHVFATISAAK